jgi:hypothetical protein
MVMKNERRMGTVAGLIFGSVVVGIGLINLFWGNDAGFGLFLLLLSTIYFPVFNAYLLRWTGFSIHWMVKIVLGLFVLWAALGVGELFGKIDLMLQHF